MLPVLAPTVRVSCDKGVLPYFRQALDLVQEHKDSCRTAERAKAEAEGWRGKIRLLVQEQEGLAGSLAMLTKDLSRRRREFQENECQAQLAERETLLLRESCKQAMELYAQISSDLLKAKMDADLLEVEIKEKEKKVFQLRQKRQRMKARSSSSASLEDGLHPSGRRPGGPPPFRPSPEHKKLLEEVDGLHLELEQADEEQAELEAQIARFRGKEDKEEKADA